MRRLLFTLLASTIGFTSYSQTIIAQEDITQGGKFIEAYFTPMAESFGSSLNNGWYNTAKPHSLGGFDLTFTLNTVVIPNSGETFNISEAGGEIFTSTSNEASTVFGSADGTEISYNIGAGSNNPKFDMPGGFKTPVMPLPMVQAGIGLIKNTSIDIRYMPILNIGDAGKVNLFGVGIKHDLLQWIPAIGNAIPMSLSLQGGYTTLDTELEVAEQKVSLNTKATTINLVASKKILMLTGYVGIGYNSSTTTFAADANFNLNGIKFDEKVDVTFESNKNLRTNIGLRLNITIITVQADYTFAEYPTATLGLGISFR